MTAPLPISVLYQLPGDIARGPLGPGELDRRLARLEAWAPAGVRCLIADAPGGPFSIENAAAEARAVAPTLDALDRRFADASAPQPDAIVIGCFGDPGLPAFRERYDVPIVGPFEAALHLGAQLGRRVGVVTMTSSVIPVLEHIARGAGMVTHYAGAGAIGVPVLELPSRMATLPDAITEVGERLVRDRDADVLVLGCMSLAFLGLAEIVGGRCGVPLLNPARTALATAAALVVVGARSSRRAYPLASGGLS